MLLRREMKLIKRERRALVKWRLVNMQEEVDDYGLQEMRAEKGGLPREPRESLGPAEGREP